MPGFGAVVRDVEKRVGHDRTIVVGDLNMNPFDAGIVGAEGLNAVMTKQIASQGGRKVDAVRYPFFYNPMWSHFGDSTHEEYPPGDPRHELQAPVTFERRSRNGTTGTCMIRCYCDRRYCRVSGTAT
jgi:hypothetical protein